MDAAIPVEDMTHAAFWRRLVRWLVDGVPNPVAITSSIDRVEPGEPLRLTAEVVDPAFVEVNDAQVLAQVTSPSGKTTEIPLEWTVSKDGEYKGQLVPDEPGTYSLKTTAMRDGKELGASTMHARASAGDAESLDAAMRSTLLTRVAEDTGGQFFTTDTASALPEAINYSGRGVTVVEERDLWDMPILLITLLGLIAAEWSYRRQRGLASLSRQVNRARLKAGATSAGTQFLPYLFVSALACLFMLAMPARAAARTSMFWSSPAWAATRSTPPSSTSGPAPSSTRPRSTACWRRTSSGWVRRPTRTPA